LVAAVYSTVARGQSRPVGADAIRVQMELVKPGQGRKVVRGSKRVHRTQNWRKNLLDRIRALGELEPPDCWQCGAPMVTRKSRKTGEFWGCSEYPVCRGTRGI